MRSNRIGSACLLAVVAMAGAACSDTASPTAPAPTRAVAALSAAPTKPRPRVPYIADLQLSSINVSIGGGFTPFTVTVTNPTPKEYQMIYLKGELKSANNQPPWPASAFLAYCPGSNGVLPRGNCTMTDGITGAGGSLSPGPGTFTLRLLQQQSDGTMKELDSTTVAVQLSMF